MSIEELARIVRSMRRCQDEYHRQPKPNLYLEVRDWQRRVDAAVAEILAPPPPPRIFGGES